MGPLTQLQRRRRREPLIHTTIPTRRTLIERQPPRRLLRNRPLTPIRLRQRILTRPKRRRPQPQLIRHITRQPRHITHTHTVITIKPNRRPQQHRRRRRNSRPALAEARGTDIRARIDQRIKRRLINRRRTRCLIQTPIPNRLVSQHQIPIRRRITNRGVMRSNLSLRQRLAIHRHLINIPHIPIHIPITNQQRQRRIRRSHRHRSLRIQHPIDIPRQPPAADHASPPHGTTHPTPTTPTSGTTDTHHHSDPQNPDRTTTAQPSPA